MPLSISNLIDLGCNLVIRIFKKFLCGDDSVGLKKTLRELVLMMIAPSIMLHNITVTRTVPALI